MNARQLLRNLRNILLIGIITGEAVYLITDGGRLDITDMALAVLFGTSYASMMWGAQAITFNLATRYLPLRSKRDVMIRVIIHGIAIVLSFMLTTAVVRAVLNPGFLDSRGTMIIIALVAFSASIIGNGAFYLEMLHQRMRSAEQAALAAELSALRARINPHFLFNSLNSIAALIRFDPAGAESLTESLADLFRYSLRTSEQPTVALAEEIASVQMYLAIERARFGDRLRVALDVPEPLVRAQVPSLILQPLVENAIKHGMGTMAGACDVAIVAERNGDVVMITITDTGPGFTSTDLDALAAHGMGLANVRDRLRLMFGEAARITLLPNGVRIGFPYRANAGTSVPQGAQPWL